MKTIPSLLLALAAPFGMMSARAAEITVHAASSLEAPLKEIGAAFRNEEVDTLKFHFGNADELARAIKEGVAGDVFFSSSDAAMDALENAKLLVEGTRRPVLSNSLVIIVPHGDVGEPPVHTFDLGKPEVKKLGLVKPGSAPAGVYAREYLEQAKLWDRVKDKVVPYENAEALIAGVDASEVDAAILFKTDALLTKNASVAVEMPDDKGPRITYAVAVLAGTRQPDPASRAVIHFTSPEAAAIFKKYGFTREYSAQ